MKQKQKRREFQQAVVAVGLILLMAITAITVAVSIIQTLIELMKGGLP